MRARAGNRRGDLPHVLDRDVRFGAAVYGSFLVASVVGVAYEAGAGARTITVALLGSMLVFWAAHVWSEVVGERENSVKTFSPLLQCALPSSHVGSGRSLKLLLSRRCSSRSRGSVYGRGTGVKLALAAALVQVVVWGFAAGRRAGGSPPQPRVAVGEGFLAVLLLGAERLVR